MIFSAKTGRSCFFEDLAGDCEKSEQHSSSTSISSGCIEKERRCSSEMKFAIVSCSSANKGRALVGTRWGRFLTHLKREKLKEEERRKKCVEKADDWAGG